MFIPLFFFHIIQTLHQPDYYISFTVKRLDMALPAWFQIQTNEVGDSQGDECGGSGPIAEEKLCEDMLSNNLHPLFIH